MTFITSRRDLERMRRSEHGPCDHGHDHGHDGHGHGHGHHHHAPKNFDRAFAVGIALNLGFVGVELIYGLSAHSLALVADAGHNFSDVLSLVLAWGASWMMRQPPSKRRTYGLGRSTILASLINAVMLFVAVGFIAWGAAGRIIHPVAVETGTMVWVALAGIAVNGITAAMFLRGSKDDLNIRGAFLHMASDALISLGVVATGIVIGFTGWLRLDPAASVIISALIAFGTIGMLRDSIDLAMDAVPASIDHEDIERYLSALPGVTAVHDLHIWSLSTTTVALTAHIIRPEGGTDDDWLHDVTDTLLDRFRINHATLQIETGRGRHSCKLQPEEVV